jgi:D-alanine-D-alanine ligase
MAHPELRIGLVYDLRDDYVDSGLDAEQLGELDRADTIDALEGALRELGHQTDRIGNLAALLPRLTAGERWDLVFDIAEGLWGFGREAQVPAVLDAFRIPYTFSDPLVSALTLHKTFTKRVLRDAGLPTPRFVEVTAPADLAALDLRFPVFAKPVAEGTSKGIGADNKAADLPALREVCRRLLARYQQPVLVEEFLPGREFTVGILGTGPRARAIGALEVTVLGDGDREIQTFRNKEECERLMAYRLVTDPLAADGCVLALRAWRLLGCRDAGRVDLRADADGRLQILEINPLAGLHPNHSDLPMLCTQLGMDYVELISAIVDSARERLDGSGA